MRGCLRLLFIAGVIFNFGAQASEAYDSTWYVTPSWAGEYPNGFSVIKKEVSVPARAGMDPKLPVSIQCRLPFKANYTPWNLKRSAKYFTATKIALLTAKEDLGLLTDEGESALVRKGEVIEYIGATSEGMFEVRFKGKIYSDDDTLLSKVSGVEAITTEADEWLNLTCESGENAWVLTRDVMFINEEQGLEFLPGLDTWERGSKEYGEAHDLSKKDLAKP